MEIFDREVRDDGGSDPRARAAIVIGAGMSGLLAARVLADHFEQVLVIESDSLWSNQAPRRGVPQSRHVHALLLRGQRILESLFPGITSELTSGGAPFLSFTRDWALFQHGAWTPRFDSDFEGYSCSRDFLEFTVRGRLGGGVTYVDRQEVLSLVASETRRRVIGVRTRSRATGDQQEYHAALVVDASGRRSQAPEWLRSLGYSAPAETRIDSHLAYSSRWYHRAAHTYLWLSPHGQSPATL
jgi:2-polyprenyl-6-methoxyphenol hydroxylase-like FAD-dependent oxidoreductase